MIADLIYDLGMHDAEDTAYYLSRGYRVVAIDANVGKIDKAKDQFPDALKAGRLVLLNVGI